MTRHRFRDRSVWISGGASGIGRASVLAFVAEGASVTFCDLDVNAGAALEAEVVAMGGKAAFIRADATVEDDVKAAVDFAVNRFGPFRHAFNNVGLSRHGTMESLSREDWDWTLAVSLTSTWLGMKYQLPLLGANGGGTIVNTASMAGKMVSEAASPAYGAAKAGVVHLSKIAAQTHADRNIRINSVSPGLVDTPVVARMLTEEQKIEIAGRQQLIRRAVKPEEIASAVLFLSSDEAAMITGTDTEVSGGRR